MMMIEMMNQSVSRAQATARSLAHLLFLATRTPAPSDAVVRFSLPLSQIQFLYVPSKNSQPGLLEGCRQGKPDYVFKADLAGLCSQKLLLEPCTDVFLLMYRYYKHQTQPGAEKIFFF